MQQTIKMDQFECDCGKKFSRKDTYLRHQKTVNCLRQSETSRLPLELIKTMKEILLDYRSTTSDKGQVYIPETLVDDMIRILIRYE